MTPATTGQAQSTQATTSDPRDHKLLRGKPVAAGIKQEVAAEAARLTESGWTPKLVSIAVGDAEPVALYIRNQKRNAEEVGIDFEERFFGSLAGPLRGCLAVPCPGRDGEPGAVSVVSASTG